MMKNLPIFKKETVLGFLFVFVFLFQSKSQHDPSAGKVCRKFEEKLYLSQLLSNDKGQGFVDSLKACMSETAELHLTLGKYYLNQGKHSEAIGELWQVARFSGTEQAIKAEGR